MSFIILKTACLIVCRVMQLLNENRRLKFLAVSFGIFSCYATFGVLQERIFRGRYGHNEEDEKQFVFPVTFVAIECSLHGAFAKCTYLKSQLQVYLMFLQILKKNTSEKCTTDVFAMFFKFSTLLRGDKVLQASK